MSSLTISSKQPFSTQLSCAANKCDWYHSREMMSSLFLRYDATQAGIWGGWTGLPFCVFAGTDGERHSEPSFHWGGPVQQSPVRDQRPERARGGRTGTSEIKPWTRASLLQILICVSIFVSSRESTVFWMCPQMQFVDYRLHSFTQSPSSYGPNHWRTSCT